MNKKRILILGPVTADPSELSAIAGYFSFLNDKYSIDCIDPLHIMEDVPNAEYYRLWEEKISRNLTRYDAFFGFAFGGVILQQCFSVFTPYKKPVILFSTPTFADKTLDQKLSTVIQHCKNNKLNDALYALYQPVFYPHDIPADIFNIEDEKTALKRLIFGLKRVLDTNSNHIIKNTDVEHLHFIGECSQLVNSDNVSTSKTGTLHIVPKASMRVLQDNLEYCKPLILEALNNEV